MPPSVLAIVATRMQLQKSVGYCASTPIKTISELPGNAVADRNAAAASARSPASGEKSNKQRRTDKKTPQHWWAVSAKKCL